jgi:CelD/BcsL family acetyltransferase involved in cellulose biosynthesis
MASCPVAEYPAGSRSLQLTVDIVSDERSLLALEPQWNALVNAAGVAHPFLTHQWVTTWWEAFGAGKTLHVLVVKAGAEVVAIAPLMRTRRIFYGIPLRCIELIANDHTPRTDFLMVDHRAEVYRAVWASLIEHQEVWDVLLFSQILVESETSEQLLALAKQHRLRSGMWPSHRSPYVPIRQPWKDYFKQLPSKHRQNIRRRWRRLSEVGLVEVEEVTQLEELDRALEDGFRIEGAAWKDQNATSMRASLETHRFYTLLAMRSAGQKWLDLCFLTVNGRRIAFHYRLRYKDRIYLLKPGYDPEYSAFSPANLLCYLSLQRAFAAGWREFDFLGSDDEWKLDWAQDGRDHHWIFIFSRSWTAGLVHSIKFRLRAEPQGRPELQKAADTPASLRRVIPET